MDPRSFYQHSEFLMQTPIPLSQSNLQPDFFQFFTNNNSQQLFLPVNHKTPSHIISSSLAPTRGTTDSTTVSNSSADHLNTPLSDENSDFSEIPFPTQNQTKTSSQLPTTSSQQHHLTNSHENPSSQDYDDETNSEHSQEDREALLNKGWKDSDDTQLLSLAKKYKCDWKKISKKFNNKKFTPYFLKIRYKDLINAPVQKKHKFTHNEDLQLAVLFEKHGSDWKTISQFFKHRTGVMLKNRYYSFIRKKDLLKTLLDEASGLTKPKIEETEDSQDESHIVKVEAESENLCLQTIEKSFITSNKVYDFDNVEFEQSLFGIMTNQDEELHTRITPMEIPVFEKPIVPSTNFQYNQNAWMMNSQFHYYSEYGMNRFQGMQTLPRY